MTRVLVVEDEESFSDALSYMLRKEGFEVAVATTGPDGLDEFERNGADLVLLDLMLPGLPGTEVCRQLRGRSNVPVIMVTAKDSEIDKVVGLEIGADDYVTKPFSSRELVARIRAVLRRRGEPEEVTPAALEAGPVRMDVDRHVVTVGGTKIDLPLKEFDLLEMLLRNAGRVLTRMQLIRPRLGCRLRRRHQDPRRPRQAAARQDRAGPGCPALPGDGPRPRLQVRAVDRPRTTARRRAGPLLGEVPPSVLRLLGSTTAQCPRLLSARRPRSPRPRRSACRTPRGHPASRRPRGSPARPTHPRPGNRTATRTGTPTRPARPGPRTGPTP